MKNVMFRIIILIMVSLISYQFFPADKSFAQAQKSAPDFTIEDLSGKKLILSDLLKTKNVILVFWTTWCPYCKAEIPHIEKFYKENKDNFAVIGINIGESKARVSSFTEKEGMSYPIVLDSDSSLAKSYNVMGVPTIVGVDKQSRIIYFGHSIKELNDIFKESK